jgi:ABC-type phosphate transport system substrate-binding protein
MKNKRMTLALSLMAASFFLSFAPARPPKVEVAIIINAGNPVTKMGADFVKNYWLRRFVKRWKETNKGILPVDYKGKSPEQDLFYKAVLGLPPNAVETYLTARQYQSGENPPEKLANDADVISYVGREIGAIGYVNPASIYENDKNIKIILTITK